jgi:hypothetical protein
MKVYCPRCGQEQFTPEIRFCSRCGFLMSGMAEVVLKGGLNQVDAEPKPISPRRKGLKHGGGWFLLGILVVPILAVFYELFRFPNQFVGLAAIIFFLGGLLRMIYALLFESGNPAEYTLEENVYHAAQKLRGKKPNIKELPAQQSIPIDAYAPLNQPNWRDTNDLEPHSVTENTTKFLEKGK